MKPNEIRISFIMWKRLVAELRRRGRGERESGAFLLAKENSNRVSRVVLYDDLDPKALEAGIITFHAPGFVELWNLCREERVRVVADIHTHPSSWVQQSESDRTHPMVAQKGHIALILPSYANRVGSGLKGVGIFEYQGDHNWTSHTEAKSPFKITFL